MTTGSIVLEQHARDVAGLPVSGYLATSVHQRPEEPLLGGQVSITGGSLLGSQVKVVREARDAGSDTCAEIRNWRGV